jgi:hypothetical protein
MTEIPMILSFKKDVNAPLVTETPVTLMMQGDANAQTIRIEMTENGAPAVLDGYDAEGYLIREDGYKVMCGGTVEGNVITVPLNAHCYAVPGAYAAFVRIKTADAQTRRTVLRIVGRVVDEGNGPLVDTENVVPNIDELLKMLDRMEEARQEVVKWAAATVEAETLAPGSQATASATEEGGKVTIKYGIPQGIQGVPGAEYLQIPFVAQRNGWTAKESGGFEQTIEVEDMIDGAGELNLDGTQIDAAEAEEALESFKYIWTAETSTGSVHLTAYEMPQVDLPLLAGVYKWVT